MNRFVATIALVLCSVGPVRAGEDEIRRGISAFFNTTDRARRVEIAEQIAADSAFDRGRMREWLQAAVDFPAVAPGLQDFSVVLADGEARVVTLRVPKDYDPKRAYPLLYALHGTGGTGAQIIPYYEHLLAERIDEFVIAAPTDYRVRAIHDGMSESDEHRRVLREVRKRVHIDAGRQYVSGYSLGGHTSWTLAMLYTDEFAAAIPIAGSFLLPEVDRLWSDFAPNVTTLHVLCCWGAKDTLDTGGSVESEQGGVAGMNRKLIAVCKSAGCDAVGFEDAEKGHGGIVPPRDLFGVATARRRGNYAKHVEHLFRFIDQSRCDWLEAFAWKGNAWTEPMLKGELREGETPRDMVAREIRVRLGRLSGKVDGQSVRVDRKQVDDLIVWFGDGLIDWSQPVELKVNGSVVYKEALTPSVFVCLEDALRTYDFDRLRWAGLHYVSGQKTRPLDAATEWPPKQAPPKPPKKK